MYEIFYNLKAEPFRLSPDHGFCYEHRGYAKARAYMAYAFIRAEGFVMITGRPGTGKTTLIGELIESLADEKVNTANLVCTQLQADDLLKMVAYTFGIDSRIVEKGELLQQLDTLLRRWHRDGRRALLVVDEAQDLSESAMEELRLLTNIQDNGKPLLQIFLLGQPELRDLVLSPALEQVHQRIVAASHLDALKKEETEAYIIHRLEKVGWQGDPRLSKAIFPLIYKFSEGVPRRINLICSRLFLHGSVEQRHEIGVADVREVILELQAENLAAGKQISEDDFEIEDDFEDAVELEAVSKTEATALSSTQPLESTEVEESHLHAVREEVVVQLGTGSGTQVTKKEKKADLEPDAPAAINNIAEVASLPAVPAPDETRKQHTRDRGKSSKKPAQSNVKRALIILLGFVASLVFAIWLVLGSGVDSIRAWKGQASHWWYSFAEEISTPALNLPELEKTASRLQAPPGRQQPADYDEEFPPQMIQAR